MDPSTELTLLTFRDKSTYHAFIHELVDESPTPSGSGDSPEAARDDFYSSVKRLKPALDDVQDRSISAKSALNTTILVGKSETEVEELTLSELYRRAGA